MNESKSLSPEVAQTPSTNVSTRQTEAISRAIIGERVRLARIAANLTQQELAGDTYSKSYISAVERGKMTPSFQALNVLAERLGRSISYFLGEGEADWEAVMGNDPSLSGLSEEDRQQREAEARHMLQEAEELLGKGQPEKALETLHVAANEPPVSLTFSERPRWYLLASKAAMRMRQFPEAISWLERGLEVIDGMLAQAPPTKRAQLREMAERLREYLGGCYYDTGKPSKALEYHSRCLAAISEGVVTDQELKLLIFKALGNDHQMLGHHQEAIGFYMRACALAEDMNNPRQSALAQWGLGLAYRTSGDLIRAETAFRKALMIFEQQDDVQSASQLHALMGLMLTERKEYQTAERHLHLSLDYAERLGDAHACGVAQGNLATFHLEQDHADEAVNAAQAGLRVLQESDDHRTLGQLYLTLADAHAKKPDNAAAEQAHKEAITTFAKTKENKLIGRSYERYGQFLADLGRFEEAYEQMGLAQDALAR